MKHLASKISFPVNYKKSEKNKNPLFSMFLAKMFDPGLIEYNLIPYAENIPDNKNCPEVKR
jgi:hypothetical protein